MDKNIIFSKISGSQQKAPPITTIVVMTKGVKMSINTSIPLGMFASFSKKPLEKSKNPAYCIITVAKNSGQDLQPELTKIRSRIFRGFFYACDKIRCVMTDCIEEPSGSPFSLDSGNANSVQSVTHQFALKVTVFQLSKEIAYNV